jgi:aminomethyltransferase
VFLVPNAANTARVVALLAAAAPAGVTVTDRHREFGVLAVQGPRSAQVLAQVGIAAPGDYMAFVDATWGDVPVRVCRTGYTGEHGYELIARWADTAALWDALLDAAQAAGGTAAGLGARDTLRTEMGYPLHGQDLSLEISPVQARSGWAVGWRKPAFWGREALLAERAAGAARTLRGIEVVERGIPRAHMRLLDADGREVGEVTSGTFSPTRRIGIGLALVATDRGIDDGAELDLDVRGRRIRVRVVKPPFVESHVR